MRAVQIRTFGEPGIVLELADLPEPPAPTADQVLIGVEHAPINMNDVYLIQGVYRVSSPRCLRLSCRALADRLGRTPPEVERAVYRSGTR